MMERLLMLRLEAADCTAEAWLNGVPIARVSPEQPTRLLPVHEFAVAGANDIALIVQPALPGMPEEPQAQLSDGQAWASVQLLLPRMGQISHPSNARTLAQLQWHVPDGEVYETPLRTLGKVELPIAFPRWRWFDAPVVQDIPAAKVQAVKLLQRLAVDLARGESASFVAAARLRFEELALAYQRQPADEVERFRVGVQALRSAPSFKPVLTSAATLLLRPVAGGRLLECLAADGRAALRGEHENGTLRMWPVRLAFIEGRPHVLR